TAISSSVTSTSNSTVASSSAVKQAYDRASQAINAANTKVSQSHISNAVNSTSTTTVASSAAVKTAYDKAVQASNVAGGKIATTAISSSVTSTSNSTVASSGAVKQAYDRANQAINAANTKVAKSHISNAVNSTSTTTVASSAAVKTAYDKAAQASNAAGGKVSKAGDTMTGSLMFSGRNQSAVGNYNYLLTDQIWSVGEQFTNDPEGKTFGNLYGLAYKYDATNMARGHQMVWCENGQPQSAIGKNVWTRGYVNARSGFLHNGQHLDNRYAQASAMIGVPIPYPSATPPAGYLAMKGQVISQSTYPKLYALYGSHLPDMRGEFIRGWDNGRGVDSGRGIKTRQGDAIRNIVANSTWAFYHQNSAFGGALRASNTVNYKYQFAYHNEGEFKNVTFDASRVVPTANENRPRNIAFNYICLAG
ncbi:MAG: tail fiber protein, partial [Gammaproteobacteria bacterium]|nr:tail fiber protein [Gammaproteobacteria bacterium]